MFEQDILASFGPFFAVTTHERPRELPWRPMAELVTDPGALAARIAQVRGALAGGAPDLDAVEMRVAASVAQLGVIARLGAPALALAVLGERDAVTDLTRIYWQPELGGPFPLSLLTILPPSGEWTGTAASVGTATPETLTSFVEGPARALVAATRAVAPVATQVLWGNVASAIHSAVRLIAAAHPEFAARASEVGARALAHPLLQHEHRVVGGQFRRRSCCLIYRIAGPVPADRDGLCGDCALRR